MNAALAAMLARVASWPDTCETGVNRDGDWVPCDKPAIGVYINQDEDLAPAGSYAWPVCVHHARVGRMVPLRELLAWHGSLARPNLSADLYAVITGADA